MAGSRRPALVVAVVMIGGACALSVPASSRGSSALPMSSRGSLGFVAAGHESTALRSRVMDSRRACIRYGRFLSSAASTGKPRAARLALRPESRHVVACDMSPDDSDSASLQIIETQMVGAGVSSGGGAGSAAISEVPAVRKMNSLRVVWDFTRPHTIVGSVLSVMSLHLFAAGAPGMEVVNLTTLGIALFWALVPACLINLYVTGLNQLCDVDIDMINKPYLPIPSGQLSVKRANELVWGSLILGHVLPMLFYPFDKGPLMATIIGSSLLGTIYSLPPFRLKRFPLLAALCIIVVRGTLINLGFYAHAAMAIGGEILTGRAGLCAAFFAVFGFVIALMKDVPDVQGDELFEIKTFSVRLGARKILGYAASILVALLASISLALLSGTVWPNLLGCGGVSTIRRCCRGAVGFLSGASALWVIKGAQEVLDEGSGVYQGTFSEKVFAYYMDLWKLFYGSYLILPFLL